uniref:Uncharacterized protein n=1 Tax=Avena sativa TaxID=4498 RepID=A0ACD5V1R6_AVESA
MASTALAVLTFAVLIGTFPPITSAIDNHGFRGSLTRMHRHSSNYAAAVHRDARRLTFLAPAPTTSPTVAVQTLAENGAGAAYHVSLSIGTPPLAFPAILDTGSDLVWTQCAPCTECFAQPTPLYDPSGSSTFSTLPCTSPLCRSLPSPFRACNATGCVYDYRYVVGFTAGHLATETLAIGGASFRDVAFGCSTANGGHMDNASGILGLGRGPLSLVSQLGIGRFSYCLRSDSDAGASPILFGSLANVTGDSVQSTPLVQNPTVPVPRAPYYYVNLTGVRVGAADLPVTFGFTSTGAGGAIVDSGTTFTYLAGAGYDMLEREFLSQTAGLLTRVSGARFDFDLCFESASDEDVDAVLVPGLVLSFAGGAEFAVPRRSYFDVVDEEGRVGCVLVLPTGGVSVIGNVMQMDLHVLYDLDGGTMSFASADCASV